MVADRIKELRENRKWTQSELAKRLGITRSSVNAWELGISVPSTQYIVELATLFDISTDYILGINKHSSINIDGLSDEDVKVINILITHLKDKNKQ